MKQGHFIAGYLVLYLICFVLLHLEQVQYDTVVKEKQRVETALQNAVDAAAKHYIEFQYEKEERREQALLQVFFESLYIYMGVASYPEKQEEIKMHIPMIILAEEDGAHFFYAVEEEETVTKIHYAWQEKVSYGTDDMASPSQAVVAEILEEQAGSIISNHNYIAKQYGLEYQFFVPRFLEQTQENMEFPIIIVVFQGWPLTASGRVTYDNCIDAAASIQEQSKYVVEVPRTLSITYSLFHEPECGVIGSFGRVLEETFTKEEAMRRFGARKCDVCGK